MSEETRYAIVRLSEINGDQEYDYFQLIQMSADADIEQEGHDVLMEIVGADAEQEGDTGKYWDSCMERLTYLYSIREITEEEYNVLKKFI